MDVNVFKEELRSYLAKPEVIEAAAQSAVDSLAGPQDQNTGFALFESRKINDRPTANLHADAYPWRMWLNDPEAQAILKSFGQSVGVAVNKKNGLSLIPSERHDQILKGAQRAGDNEFGLDLSLSSETPTTTTGFKSAESPEWAGAPTKFQLALIAIPAAELNFRSDFAKDLAAIAARRAERLVETVKNAPGHAAPAGPKA